MKPPEGYDYGAVDDFLRPTKADLNELIRELHPGLNRHDRRVELRRMLRHAERRFKAERAGGGVGVGS